MTRNRLLFWLLVLPPLAAITALSLLLTDAGRPLTAMMAAAGAVALLLIVWTAVDRLLLQPLAAAAKAAAIIAHSNPGHRPELPEPHLLGDLPAALLDLGAALYRAERRAAAVDAAVDRPLARQTALLETILHELWEGVLVCAGDGRIWLYNRAARRLLNDHPGLGLGRPVEALFEHDALADARRLLATHPADEPSGHAEFACASGDGRTQFRCRIGQLAGDRDPAKTPADAFVITFNAAAPTTQRRWVSGEPLPARPEFYYLPPDTGRPLPDELLARPLASLSYVVFDTETTGLRPAAGDKIIQIAGVRVVGGRVLTGETFDALVNPGRPIPAASRRFHGISDADVADQPDIGQRLAEFRRFVGDDDTVLVAHNAAFDLAFIEQQTVHFDNPVLDTLLLSAYLHGHAERHDLDAIAERLGISVAGRHQALGDSLATARVLIELLRLARADGIETLAQALAVTEQMTALRRQQRRFRR